MECRGSGFKKIIEEYKAQHNYSDEMAPVFRSEHDSFFLTLMNLNYRVTSDNTIAVSLPFDRLDLDKGVQDDVQDGVQEQHYLGNSEQIEQAILNYCVTAKSTAEITDGLGISGRKTASRFIRRLIERGKLAMTFPEKPNSRYQKYITIK